MLPIGNAVARGLVNSVTVAGIKPKGAEDWKCVSELVEWRLEARKALARWTSLSGEFDFEVMNEAPEQAIRNLTASISIIKDVDQLQFDFDAHLEARVAEVFGKNISTSLKNDSELAIANVRESLQSHLDKGRLGYAMRRVQEISKKLDGHSGNIVTKLRDFLTYGLGQLNSNEDSLQADWLAKMAELEELQSLWTHISTIAEVADRVEQSGAPKWANRIRTQVVESEIDNVVPFNWREAWDWRLAVSFLDRLDSHHKIRDLIEERRQLTHTLAKTYQELVAEKTWLGVFNNSPDSVRQALQAYLNAVQAMGAGTGVRAVRHRKNARDAMVRAYRNDLQDLPFLNSDIGIVSMRCTRANPAFLLKFGQLIDTLPFIASWIDLPMPIIVWRSHL